MSNPLTIILDGLFAAQVHWQSLLGVGLILLVSQLFLYSALKRIFGDQFSVAEYYSISLAGWILPASLISFVWYGVGKILSPQIGLLIAIIFFLITSLISLARTPRGISNSAKPVLFLLILLAMFSLILRLAFVEKAVLPMYFDSAQHYLWIRDISSSLDSAQGTWSLVNYYHLGFHFLAAFITFITRAQINDTMLLLGQMILAVMPFSVFFLVRHWTGSNVAGIFAVILAAFGWYMPAHAVDWGKYPALASIDLIPFVLSIAYLSIQNRIFLSKQRYWSLNILVLIGMLVSVFLHSRSLIVFFIVALTWVITSIWQKLRGAARLLVAGLVLLALISGITFIQTKGILSPLFDPYGSKGLVVTLLVLMLSIFAYRAYPALVFSCIVAISLLLASVFIPLGNLIPGYANMTVLDRPFVEMILYLPLTLLGGFGLAGLEQYLQNPKFTFLSRAIVLLSVMLVVINGLFRYDFYPSDCCDIASYDDLEAIGWMGNNLPQDVRILVSSTELNVLPTDEYQGSAGGDAGTWINPLIGRTTIFMPFTTDFSQPQTLATICQLQVDYVYVGKTGWGFNDATMQADRYNLIFSIPNTKIYQVTGCGAM